MPICLYMGPGRRSNMCWRGHILDRKCITKVCDAISVSCIVSISTSKLTPVHHSPELLYQVFTGKFDIISCNTGTCSGEDIQFYFWTENLTYIKLDEEQVLDLFPSNNF